MKQEDFICFYITVRNIGPQNRTTPQINEHCLLSRKLLIYISRQYHFSCCRGPHCRCWSVTLHLSQATSPLSSFSDSPEVVALRALGPHTPAHWDIASGSAYYQSVGVQLQSHHTGVIHKNISFKL